MAQQNTNQGAKPNNNPEKICMQATRVFDACISKRTRENMTIQITQSSNAKCNDNLAFKKCTSHSNKGVFSSLAVTPINMSKNLSRVQATVDIPVKISFVDSNGTNGYGLGIISEKLDIVMCLPSASIIQPEIKSTVSITAPIGEYLGKNTFKVTYCATIIMKATSDVDILIPSYGYPLIPPCQDYAGEACLNAFDAPLYPD